MNVRNTYFRFVLVEYSSFQHGEPSVFWSSIQNHMSWLKKSSKMNFGSLFFAATNAHGKDDEEFTRLYPDGIPEDESGCVLCVPCQRMALIALRIQT